MLVGMDIQNHMAQQKFQPVRVKELLHYCESDDDESEGKPQNSDSESDSDEPQPLPQDDSVENNINESFPVTTTYLKTTSAFLQTNASMKSVDSITKTVAKNKACNEVPKICVSVHKNYSDAKDNNVKSKSVLQDNRIRSTNFEINSTAKCETSASQSITFHNSEHTKRSGEHSINYEAPNHVQLNCEGIHNQSSNVDIKIQSHEEQLSKNDFQSTDQHNFCIMNTNNEVEPITFGSQNFGSSSQAGISNLENTNNKVETLESKIIISEEKVHCESIPSTNKSLTSDTGTLTNPVDHLSLQTPLKHSIVGSIRPELCYSRRNINQTPQSKGLSDISKSIGLTPSTITSHWAQSSIRQTPIRNENVNYKDSIQTPQNVVYFTPSMLKHKTPRYLHTNNKERRPLADTGGFLHSDICNRQLHQGSQLSKINEITPKVQNKLFNEIENRHSNISKEIFKVSEKAYLESDINEQLKEHKSSNAEDALLDKEARLQSKMSNNKYVTHSNKDSKEILRPTSSESQNQYSSANNQNQQQNIKKIADNASNVQFSMPSNIPKSKHSSKTLFIKGKEYLIIGTLGQGMSGEVLRAQDLSTLELCAIKCVYLNRMDKDSAQGCLEEISMLHKLQAPHIVKMFDYEIKYPMVYVVMEMGDTDLSRLLKTMSQDKQISLTMIFYYWTEMLTAVKHIHDNGVIHSDLKPANFLLVRGRLKLIDFGIASSMNADMTSVVKNCPIGTLNYISPEALMDIGGNGDSPTQNVKYKITFKSDVWSLGCILYSLVYGRTPFHHIRSQWAKVNAITNPKPNIPFPETLPSVNGEAGTPSPLLLIDVMRKCLQHDPKARPTVAELLQIQYIPAKQERIPIPVPEIPTNILVKIKHTLNEDEWRQLIRILEERRNI